MIQTYEDLTGAQKLVLFYKRLRDGELINPTQYAADMGVYRQTVYRQLDALSGCWIPVVNVSRGFWCLEEFVSKYEDKV